MSAGHMKRVDPIINLSLDISYLKAISKMFLCQLMNSEDRPSKHPQVMIKGAHINVFMHYITKTQPDK